MKDGAGTGNVMAPSLLQLVQSSFPGGEIVEFVDASGRVFLPDEIKAIEWQERNEMQINHPAQEALKKLSQEIGRGKPAGMRTMKALFEFNGEKILLCNDDTLWFLRGHEANAEWMRAYSAALPQIPQEG